MTVSRFERRRKILNRKKLYKGLFDVRDVKFIRQFSSPKFDYPTQEQINSLELVEYDWRRGDKYSKVAEYAYGDPELWWVIAWFNKKPTEAHLSYGDTIQIPFPLSKVFRLMGV